MKSIVKRLLPAPRGGGFKLENYFVWCGSLIRAGGKYHMFASRWPKETGFPEGYRRHSEIVRAVSDTPEGPYAFQEVVLSGRGGNWWDGRMCHNPKICNVGGLFVLYYNASDLSNRLLHGRNPRRQVGYASSASVHGPWKRIDQPLPLGEDNNNPAPCFHEDGSVLLIYRDWDLRMHIAKAPAYDGPYEVVARNFFPEGRLEDPDVHFDNGRYHMVVEDNQAKLTGHERFGGYLVSEDGIRWRRHAHPCAYTHEIVYDDGTRFTAERRERPELFNATAEIKGNGPPSHLATGILYKGETWNLVQPIAES